MLVFKMHAGLERIVLTKVTDIESARFGIMLWRTPPEFLDATGASADKIFVGMAGRLLPYPDAKCITLLLPANLGSMGESGIGSDNTSTMAWPLGQPTWHPFFHKWP